MPHHASSVAEVVTVSIGVAMASPTLEGSPEALLHAADRALYVAKAQGRNRAIAA
jgi:diguanylate cyclase (GGDEF)-like protein